MKNVLLTITVIFISFSADAFPCNKYVLDFKGKVMSGDIRISWSINKGFNNCGFEKDEILKRRFIVRIESLFEDVILRDTVDQNHFSINTSLIENPAIVFIQELGNDGHSIDLLIKPEREEMPQLLSRIDTLNFYLLNGYILNATSMLASFDKKELINQLKSEYDILFPEHYPDEQTYFNCYLDSNSMNLVKMPIVEGLPAFIEALNESTKNEPKRDKGFKIFAKITPDGKLGEYQVIPKSEKPTFEKFVGHLTFSNPSNEIGHVVIIVGRSKNKKKFTIVNERALMDQRSTNFKRKFNYRGWAVH